MSDRPETRPRRLVSRYALALVVQVQAPGLPSLHCQARNVSVGGLFFSTDAALAPASRVAIKLSLADGRSATLDARVVHVLAGQKARSLGLTPGVGVHFEKLDQQTAAFVRELVDWAAASDEGPRIARIKPGADVSALQHEPLLRFLLGYVDGRRDSAALSEELALEVDTIERMLGELRKLGAVELATASPVPQPPAAATPKRTSARAPETPARNAQRASAPVTRAAVAQAPGRAVRSQPPPATQRASARPSRAQAADTAAAAQAASVAAASSARPSRAPDAAAAAEAARVAAASCARLSQAPAAVQPGRARPSRLPSAGKTARGGLSQPPALGAAAQILAQAEAAYTAGHATEACRHLKLLSAMTFNDAAVQRRANELKQQVSRAAAVDFEKQAAQEERNQAWDRAAKSWLRVAEGRPQDGLPLQRAALAQLQAGVELRQVMETAKRAVQLTPNDAQAHRTLAKVYMAADMQASADRELDAARRCSPLSGPSEDTPTGLLKRLLGRQSSD